MFNWKKPKPFLQVKKTRRGFTTTIRGVSNSDAVMELLYVGLNEVAKRFGIDFRFMVKQMLKIDSRYKKALKEKQGPRYPKSKKKK